MTREELKDLKAGDVVIAEITVTEDGVDADGDVTFDGWRYIDVEHITAVKSAPIKVGDRVKSINNPICDYEILGLAEDLAWIKVVSPSDLAGGSTHICSKDFLRRV